MTLKFIVEKVAQTRHVAWKQDPDDPNNTIPAGNREEVTLELIPDQNIGGGGIGTIVVNDVRALGQFKQGQVVEVDFKVVG